jgi:hypothetical protein
MSKYNNLEGKVFGRYLVKKLSPKRGFGAFYQCQCQCGSEKIVRGRDLAVGTVVSCGCYKKDKASSVHRRHGRSNSRVYTIWYGMKMRCRNPRHHKWYMYGGAGIEVDPVWNSFEAFLRDMGEPPSPLHQIDRIDWAKGYGPGNCRWATPKEQSANIKTNHFLECNGVRLHVSEWARRIGCPKETLFSRLRLGWTHDDIINVPVKKRKAPTSRASAGKSSPSS